MAGANRSMLQLILELRESYGVEPFVLLPIDREHGGMLKYKLKENHIPFKEIHISSFKKRDKSAFSRWNVISSYRQIRQLTKELKNVKFDLVHSNSSVIDLGAYLSRELEVKHIWHLREFGDLDYYMHSIFGALYERFTYRNAEGYIAISKCINNHFCNTISHDKINTIYNGIMPKSNVPLATHTNPTIQFLCAGSYGDTKNLLEVLLATEVIVNEYRIEDFHVTTVGWGINSSYALQMKQFVTDHSLGKFVSILGESDGIAELASTMDVGIMPSRNEAFGRVTVEYMLQNLAVIANDSGANTEIIENGKSGLIYNRADFHSLADKMRELIEDRSKLATLARAGKNRAEEMFLSSLNTKAVFETYQNVHEHRAFSSNVFPNLICKMELIYYGIISYPLIKLHGIRVRLRIKDRLKKLKF